MSNVSIDRAGLNGEHALMGRSIFTGDICLPGMLHGCLLGSPQARGQLNKVDLKEALKAPGTVAALGNEGLLNGQVEYLGQPVAAICAETADAAAYAMGKIKYEFASQEAVFDIDKALADDAASLRKGGNVVAQGVDEKGDVENALAQAEQVVMARFQTAPKALAGLEPAACVAAHEPDGGMVLYANRGSDSGQGLILAQALDMEPAMLRVVCLGSAVAGPWETAMQYAALCLAIKSGRAVKIVPSLADDVSYGLRTPGTVISGRAGVDASGHITALDLDISVDAGANTFELSQAVAMAGAMRYTPDNFRMRIRQVVSSNPPALISESCVAAQVCFAMEGLINESARQLGMDALDLRLANVESGGLVAKCLNAAKQADLWDGGKQTGAACFAMTAAGAEPCPGVALVRADTDKETGVVGLMAIQMIIGSNQSADDVSSRGNVLAQVQNGVATAMISGLRMVNGVAVNPTDKRMPNTLDMPKVELALTGDGEALEIGAGPSFGVAPALAASVAATSGGFCTELPITAEGLLKATGRIR